MGDLIAVAYAAAGDEADERLREALPESADVR
jgi:hypothetical protein